MKDKLILDWITIRDLNQNKFLLSFNVWLWLVPILAKIFQHINNPINFSIFGTNILINLQLPFSWQMFFFGALFISIGNILYSVTCPEIIKKYKTYHVFTSDCNSSYYLAFLYNQLVKEDPSLGSHGKECLSDTGYPKNENRIADLFYIVVNQQKKAFASFRMWCCLSYYLGLILIGFIILKNIYFVIQNTHIV